MELVSAIDESVIILENPPVQNKFPPESPDHVSDILVKICCAPVLALAPAKHVVYVPLKAKVPVPILVPAFVDKNENQPDIVIVGALLTDHTPVYVESTKIEPTLILALAVAFCTDVELNSNISVVRKAPDPE